MDLTYRVPEGATTGQRTRYFADLYPPDGPSVAIWWRVGAAGGDPCLESDDRAWDDSRHLTDPTPSETYDLLRTARAFESTEEEPFAFAGATGRSVDLTVRRGWGARRPPPKPGLYSET